VLEAVDEVVVLLLLVVVVTVLLEFVPLLVDWTCNVEFAGGVDDPNRDGIETDDKEDVDETGDGIAVTLVGGGSPFVVTLEVVGVPDPAVVTPCCVGPNKFDIVGGCFTELCCGDIDCCLEFGDVDVVDVVVQVDGILAAVDTGLTPFCVAGDG
jgi:hypothetical protein